MLPLPWMIGGALGISAALFGWGYYKGHESNEAQCLADKNDALMQQYAGLVAQFDKERALAEQVRNEINRIADRVEQVPEPDNCELTPDCLRWYDDTMRAAANESRADNAHP